jgi:hypothetical protein
MKVSATINATSLRDTLKRLDKRYQVAIDKELALTAVEIESSYKVNVPFDLGRLWSSIHFETKEQKAILTAIAREIRIMEHSKLKHNLMKF